MSGVQQNCPLLKRRFQVKSRASLSSECIPCGALGAQKWLPVSTDRAGRRLADPEFSHSRSSRRPLLHGGLPLRCCVLLQAQQLTLERLISLDLLSCSL